MQNNHNTHESNQHRMLQIHNENSKSGAFKCFSSFIFRYIRLYVLVQLCMFGFVYLCARFVFFILPVSSIITHCFIISHLRTLSNFILWSKLVYFRCFFRTIRVCWFLWTHANKTQHKRCFFLKLLLFENAVTRIKYQIPLSNWPVCCLLAHVLCTGSVHCFILFSFLEFVCVYFWSKFINNNNDRNMKQIFVCEKFKIHLFFQRKKKSWKMRFHPEM